MAPDSEAELAEAIAGAKAPLWVIGGGTRLVPEGAPLSVARLSGITLYEPGALTMIARAGTPLGDIEAALDAEGQMLAFEPYDVSGLTGSTGQSTIGGVFATNASGPRRAQAGAARDFLLGVRFVDGAGQIVKNGGRVMKNVTGYDLVKLMAGAHGTLGVLSEVSFKVLPKPEVAQSIAINGLDDGTAIDAMAAALASPYDVSGAAHWSKGAAGHPVTHIRIEGFADSVAYRAERLVALLSQFGDVMATDDLAQVNARWTQTRDAAPFTGSGRDVWRLSVRPSQAASIVARLPSALFNQGWREVIYDWGGARVWLQVEPGTDLRAHLGEFTGHATLIRGSGAPRFPPQQPAIARISAALRAKFDPRSILNRGLMG
ncbi:FAD-binding protein [Aliiroseovarius sp. PTFE2010]|uniref:FAD-binding protein n=1 Tax=Aliiroseovarius sp. PTFE2010 TaxID=3417190 RepID=UPI003CEB22D8